MPLQNRVTPFGDIVALPGRGLLTGNRGVLVDGERRIARRWHVKRWLACVLHVPGRRRKLMQPHVWTELFFLDEAAAFAAGHRPCAACRLPDYHRFRDLWILCHGTPAGADDMDRVLHAERVDRRSTKRTYQSPFAGLPDGTFVVEDGTPWLARGEQMYRWTDAGYTARRDRPADGLAWVLTPRAIVAILAAGYAPLIHPSAG